MHSSAPLDLQLRIITGGDPRSGDLIEIRYRHRNTGPMRQHFHDAGRATLATTIDTLSQRGDVYIGAAPRKRKAGGKDALSRVCTVWADIDTPEAIAALEAFPHAPSLTVKSGSGENLHAWWALSQPVSPAEAERSNRRVSAHLGADMRSCDAARILRPVGALNWKHTPPRPVEATASTGQVHELHQLLRDVPEITGPPVPVVQPIRRDDPLLDIPPAEYVPMLTGREVNRAGKMQCPFHNGGEESDPSFHVYDVGRGWWCFGCDQGGSIIDLGAKLYGITPRGKGFHDIRRRLAGDLLAAIEASA